MAGIFACFKLIRKRECVFEWQKKKVNERVWESEREYKWESESEWEKVRVSESVREDESEWE